MIYGSKGIARRRWREEKLYDCAGGEENLLGPRDTIGPFACCFVTLIYGKVRIGYGFRFGNIALNLAMHIERHVTLALGPSARAYLVILLPGAGSAFVDNFTREQCVLAGIDFSVLGLFGEALERQSVCGMYNENELVFI